MIRFRKFSPIDREYSIFEALDDDEAILFDVSMTDDGRLEISFYSAIAGRILAIDDFQAALAEGIRLTADERSN